MNRAFLLIFVFFMLISGSCSMKQDIYLNKNGSGSVDFNLEIKQVLLEYLMEMGELAEEDLSKGIFKLDEIEKGLQNRSGVTIKTIEAPTPASLHINFDFRALEALFPSEDTFTRAGAISMDKKADGSREIKVHLSQDNYKQLLDLLSLSESFLVEMFGPQEDSTEEEYIDMVEFMLGEDGRSQLLSSNIEVVVRLNGTLVSQSGGKVTKEGVLFNIPLVKAANLEKDLDYSLIFR